MIKNEPQKTILSKVAFNPSFDFLIDYYGIYTAAVFGKIWRYSKMSNKVSEVSRKRIAKELKISTSMVKKAYAIFVKEELITDTTPHIRRATHKYAVNEKQIILLHNVWASKQSDMSEDIDK